MDWKTLGSTFVTVFLAELGDKTQLATFGIAGSSQSRMAVFLGAAGALVATSAMAVLLGDAVTRAVPPIWIHRAAGVAFIVMGFAFLAGKG